METIGHRRLDQRLRESRDLFAAVIGSAMDAIIVIDDEEHVLLFNAAAEKMFGCSASDAVGYSIERFIPERFRQAHHTHISHFGESGLTTRTMGALGTVWGSRADGSEFPIEASIAHTKVRGGTLFAVVLRDATDRLRAEDALKRSERRSTDLVLRSPIPMVVSRGPGYECELVNLKFTELFGYTIEDMPDEAHWWPLAYPDEAYRRAVEAEWREHIRQAALRNDEQIVPMEAIVQRKDGSKRHIEFHFASIGDTHLVSFVDLTERKMAEDALARLSGRLIEAQDEERRRIAREIHDDYQQRLALLAIELKNLAEEFRDSSSEAGRQLNRLSDGATELGADLHSLSHRLHSSTLETLGLVAGVRAFCEEFSERQGTQVDFVHENVPRGIPLDAALCMFRITQEALRNVNRHSGSNKAEVRLEQLDGKLHLSVSDHGSGFDSHKPSTERGIGIHSMEERLRLLGGRLEIHSQLMEGTRIDAWIPLKTASTA